MKYIGIIGSRKRDSDHDLKCCEKQFLKIYEDGDIIVSGGCPQGGDRFAEVLAKKYCKEDPIIFPAKWKVNGVYDRGAGLKRNALIADKSDVLIAIVTKDLSKSSGTMSTVGMVQAQGKETILDDDEETFNPENIG
jgi:hypothetical protein